VLAADTLVTGGDTRVGFKTKIAKVGNVLVSATGTNALHIAFISWVKGGCKGNCPPMAMKSAVDGTEYDATGIIIMPDHRCVTFRDTVGVQWATGPYFAFGSGQDYARGAFHMGATAEEAVRAAMEFDVNSGGVIESLRHH
jgi:hypothetical protein